MIRFGQIVICGRTQTIRNGEHLMDCRISATGGSAAKRRFRTFKYLLCANGNGLTRSKLFELVYGNDVDGGPEMGVHIFDVHFSHWDAAIKRMGLAIKREKRAGEMYLRMVPVSHVV